MALVAGLHHAEALIEGLLGILADQIDQRALLAALRNVDLHPALLAFGQHLFQRRTVFEIHRHVNRVRHVLLIEINLLQQRREKLARVEAASPDQFA